MGWTLELKPIVDNWGETLGDSQALRALRSFTRTRRFFWGIVAIREKHRRRKDG
jgi:hypothetical protein